MDLMPHDDLVMIKPVVLPSGTTAGGLHIPDTAEKDKPALGVVIKIGPGRIIKDGPLAGTRLPMSTKPETVVLFNRYSGHKFRLFDEEYIMLRDEQVLSTVKDAPDAIAPKPPAEVTPIKKRAGRKS